MLEALLERALTAYHRDELHGGARWLDERLLDDTLVPITREAFLEADELPPDEDVRHVLHGASLRLKGEGYHVIALAEPGGRFVVKYAKRATPVPPLAPPVAAEQREWERDYGVAEDGTLHAAIWQHIRAFESYGPLAVASRVYLADSAAEALSDRERRALRRFRAIGIVRSLGAGPCVLRIDYPDEFPGEKRAPDGVTVSVLVAQPLVTPVATAIERALRAGDVDAAHDLKSRYEQFTEQLWRCGVSHLDFSMLNIAVRGSGAARRLQIFDPHLGVIETSADAPGVRDPLPPKERSVDSVLRSSRDGTRWALWRVQQAVESSEDVPSEAAAAATALVRDFHIATEGLEEGAGTFGFEHFDESWRRRRLHTVNTVLHAQMWALLRHPIGGLVRAVMDPGTADGVYDRTIPVLGMDDDRPLGQFCAGLKVFEDQPLILIANVTNDGSVVAKHWGRVRLPAELDVQDDPAIHYHLRDLFTGEVYVQGGDDLVRRGFVAGLPPGGLHVLRVEDVRVADLAVERSLAAHRDIAEFVADCTKRVGVVGDVHGELHALQEILRALGFVDAIGDWSARDGVLVFTGDIGHGRHLQEVFDFIHRLAGQAHQVGGRIVWTLGNHDLYMDREGGQGGEDSLGYRLWPTIREAALHPERHPGLTVQAAYFAHGKVFVHGGILPNIVELARRERGAGDAETVAAYVNDVFRQTLVERERITARDLPHEMFHIGTSHARERRMPDEIGYEPAGVFTPDLRELDHYRYHGTLLPQVVGHTASRRGRIRYSPGSWLERQYIAIDVGRQHGTGNGGLLLTDFGWVAVTPAGAARLVEVTPMFVALARQQSAEGVRDAAVEAQVRRMLGAAVRSAERERPTLGELQEVVLGELAPEQLAALEQFLTMVRRTGRSVIVTDLDEMLTAFSGSPLKDDSLEALAEYLGAGGVLVLIVDTGFDWLYARLLLPLVAKLGVDSGLLAHLLLLVSGGTEIFAFHDSAYERVFTAARRGQPAGVDVLPALAKDGHLPKDVPALDPSEAAFIINSRVPRSFERADATTTGVVIDIGDAVPATTGKPISDLHRGYVRAIAIIDAATAALRESGLAGPPRQTPGAGDTALWTFEQPRFPDGVQLRVRVGGSGFVHAGLSGPDGAWHPIYDVPLVPTPEGGYEATLPAGVNAFTFFWTEAPWTPGHPGHWERGSKGPRIFRRAGR